MKPHKKQQSLTSVENLEGKVEAALRRLVDTNLVTVLFIDLAGKILNADESFLNMLGYTSGNLPRNIHDLTPPEHHRLDQEAFEKLMAFGACAPFEKEFLKRDGTQVPVLFGAAMHEEEIACFVVDLSQNRQTQEKLNHLAYHDALTDLPNQVLFKDRLKQAIALSHRTDQMQAVLLLNVDRFKTINDSLGYTSGDRLLQSVAERLTSCVRESDTVARFGGDEFAVLLTQIPAHSGRCERGTRDQTNTRPGVYLRRPGDLRFEQYRYQSLSAGRPRHGGTVERQRAPRSIARRGRVATTFSFIRPAERRALSNNSYSKAICDRASNVPSSLLTTSRRSTCVAFISSAWKRWCAGNTRVSVCYIRVSLCRWQKRAG
jgi:PAS domain S-box-containing protein